MQWNSRVLKALIFFVRALSKIRSSYKYVKLSTHFIHLVVTGLLPWNTGLLVDQGPVIWAWAARGCVVSGVFAYYGPPTWSRTSRARQTGTAAAALSWFLLPLTIVSWQHCFRLMSVWIPFIKASVFLSVRSLWTICDRRSYNSLERHSGPSCSRSLSIHRLMTNLINVF